MREKNGGVEIDQNEDDSHRTWFSSSSPSFGCHPFHGRYVFSRFSSFSSPSSQQLREEKKKRTRSTSSESVESSEGRHMLRHEESAGLRQEENKKGSLTMDPVFARDSSLKHHLRTVHGGGDKPFACPLCKKTFRYNRGNLEQHIQAVHKGIKPFECKICKKTFSQKGNLGQHIRAVHAGKKPFQCPECLRAFSRKSHLTRHIESLGHRKLNMSPSPLPSSSFSASYGNENNSEQPVNTSR
ncbi:zinc c2h2 type domain-containing protein [Cystoisospora suis]|uniref:Zinc c2h2 type domain-containing protein n=1 Tax=Cystoisospora suis TaxID=483139 RepID=A0A2C6KGG8_9APIC|nr:zinc c2h2 type domain-containing protein [Cystoisospora suis]